MQCNVHVVGGLIVDVNVCVVHTCVEICAALEIRNPFRQVQESATFDPCTLSLPVDGRIEVVFQLFERREGSRGRPTAVLNLLSYNTHVYTSEMTTYVVYAHVHCTHERDNV